MSKPKIQLAALESLRVYPKLLRHFPLLALVHIISYLGAEMVTWQKEEVLSSGKENLLALFSIFAGAFITDIVFSTIWIIAVVRLIQKTSFSSSHSKKFISDLNYALIESIRALARMLRWLPLFILPGLIKLVRLSFVPFIVVDDPHYQKGSIDALNRSEELVKRHFWLVLFALLLSTLLPAVPGIVFQGENISLASTPMASITWSVFEFFTSLLATTFLYSFYRQVISHSGVHHANF